MGLDAAAVWGRAGAARTTGFRTKRKKHQDWPKEMEVTAVDGSYCPKDANNY